MSQRVKGRLFLIGEGQFARNIGEMLQGFGLGLLRKPESKGKKAKLACQMSFCKGAPKLIFRGWISQSIFEIGRSVCLQKDLGNKLAWLFFF